MADSLFTTANNSTGGGGCDNQRRGILAEKTLARSCDGDASDCCRTPVVLLFKLKRKGEFSTRRDSGRDLEERSQWLGAPVRWPTDGGGIASSGQRAGESNSGSSPDRDDEKNKRHLPKPLSPYKPVYFDSKPGSSLKQFEIKSL